MDAERSNSLVRYIYRAVGRHHDAEAPDAELLQRFVVHRDETAFAVLVRRYGPLVFGVCQRVLQHRQDAEDAFQATFLVLVHKAGSIAQPELLGNWLYGVAYNTAKNAKVSAARRRARERRAIEMSQPPAQVQEEKERELRMLLDEELSRLPQKYRAPVVLCELHGKSRKEAALLLGCPEGTLSSRLARARQLLRAQLTKRGLALSAGSLTTALSPDPANASVPALLIASVIKTAMIAAASQASLAGVVSPHVAALTKGVLKTMFFAKIRIWTATLLAMSVVVGAGMLAHQVLAAKPAQPPIGTPPAYRKARSPAAEPESIKPAQGMLMGRFTAADTGKPLAGVKLRVLILGLPGKAPFAEASSDSDGRYALTLPLGHCRLWGVDAPAGYYTQSSRTFDMIATTPAQPRIVRDFVLRPGSPWHVELHGATSPAGKPPFFYALPEPERHGLGDGISAIGDARGKAVLTIPVAAGHFRFTCGLLPSPSPYEIPVANLEIDKDFDPRRIQGKPKPLAARKPVRLRDAAGRVAVVEGAEVAVVANQAVLRFHAQRIPAARALRFRGAAVDEAGKPVAGAKVTAAFGNRSHGAMSQLNTFTDAQGKFELSDVLLPQSYWEGDSWIRMFVTKASFDGAQTKELNLLEAKRAGSGDFGTVVLGQGHALHGKVVDEKGQPVQGAVVTNQTNYFLYGNLQCRTDAQGRFAMPDLSFGSQELSALYGERYGKVEFNFDANSGECVITVRLRPMRGSLPNAAPLPAPPAQPAQTASDRPATVASLFMLICKQFLKPIPVPPPSFLDHRIANP